MSNALLHFNEYIKGFNGMKVRKFRKKSELLFPVSSCLFSKSILYLNLRRKVLVEYYMYVVSIEITVKAGSLINK